MRFLKNERGFKRWEKEEAETFTPPDRYPCFGYTFVESFGMESLGAKYLYPDDIIRMQRVMKGAE